MWNIPLLHKTVFLWRNMLMITEHNQILHWLIRLICGSCNYYIHNYFKIAPVSYHEYEGISCEEGEKGRLGNNFQAGSKVVFNVKANKTVVDLLIKLLISCCELMISCAAMWLFRFLSWEIMAWFVLETQLRKHCFILTMQSKLAKFRCAKTIAKFINIVIF